MKKLLELLPKILIFIVASELYFFLVKKLVNMITTTIQYANMIDIICVLIYICIVCPITLMLLKKLG